MSYFARGQHLAQAVERSSTAIWDMVVIGGGATGIGIALDAASRDYSVLLLEQADFGKGTSSRSTKLVHGGVRYLQQGNIALVREALQERALLVQAAPHVVHDLPFIIPCRNWWQAFFYGTGLKVYDLLAGRQNLGKSRKLSRSQVAAHLPTIEPSQAAAGILYHDGQFDDARLLINLAQTAARHGGTLLNYAQVNRLEKDSDGRVAAVQWRDLESQSQHLARARVVINATGPFVDSVRSLDDPTLQPMVAASQGIHLVLAREFMPGSTALMVPKTSDGRVVFLIPWHGALVLGTTDTAIDRAVLEPTAEDREIDFLLETVGPYLKKKPTRADVQSVFTGIRPLVKAAAGTNTSRLSRDHTIEVSDSGLITITGGKWTTYRKMAEECVDRAAALAGLSVQTCRTRKLTIVGASTGDRPVPASDHYRIYGSEAAGVQELLRSWPEGDQRLDDRLSLTPAMVVWAARHEMARTVEDVLARRTRALFLHAQAALDVAPRVAQILAEELGRDPAWQEAEVERFQQTAQCFLPRP